MVRLRIIRLLICIILLITKAHSGFSYANTNLRIPIESLDRLDKIQMALKTQKRAAAYDDWHSNSRTPDMFSEEALREKKVFLRYGKGADSVLPSGRGYYGQSAVVYLRPSHSLQQNMTVIYDAFRDTKTYKNGKLRFYDFETVHHTLRTYTDFQEEPISVSLQANNREDLQKNLKGTSGFGIYLEGVNWDANDYKFVLQAYPPELFLDIEGRLRGRHYPRIEFTFCLINDELTEEELDELLLIVDRYAKVPIGVQEIEAVSLVHHKDEMLADPISVEDIDLHLSGEHSLINLKFCTFLLCYGDNLIEL